MESDNKIHYIVLKQSDPLYYIKQLYDPPIMHTYHIKKDILNLLKEYDDCFYKLCLSLHPKHCKLILYIISVTIILYNEHGIFNENITLNNTLLNDILQQFKKSLYYIVTTEDNNININTIINECSQLNILIHKYLQNILNQYHISIEPITNILSNKLTILPLNVSSLYKAIFIHIPKTGGTTIEQLLFINNKRGIQQELKSQHSNLNYYLSNNLPKNYFIFTVVRNPYTRAISLFNFYKNEGNNSNADKNFLENNTIDEFYRRYEYYNNKKKNMLSPQVWYIDPNNISKVNYIIKFESYKTQLEEVCNILQTSFNNDNVYQITDYRKKEYTNYTISPYLINRINELYSKDFTTFGYKKVTITNNTDYESFKKLLHKFILFAN